MGKIQTFKVKGVSFDMVYVEGGTFWMGVQRVDLNGQNYDSEAYFWGSPVRQVTLDSYYIGKFEVTQALWQAIMGSNPSYFTGNSQRPVEQVSWDDIVYDFLPMLNSLTGSTFALPTEAQWEFAARGGNESQHYKYSGSNTIDNVAWHNGNSGSQTHPVGQKQDNELGIYDMSGNVWEWCNDEDEEYIIEPQPNSQGPYFDFYSYRVLRGGSWYNGEYFCRVSIRRGNAPDIGNYSHGFRLMLIP